jgi:hypothetical protein
VPGREQETALSSGALYAADIVPVLARTAMISAACSSLRFSVHCTSPCTATAKKIALVASVPELSKSQLVDAVCNLGAAYLLRAIRTLGRWIVSCYGATAVFSQEGQHALQSRSHAEKCARGSSTARRFSFVLGTVFV